MIDCTDTADYIWLTGEEARLILVELAAENAPLHTAIARLRGKLSPGRTHLLIEQVELRRRAAAKFAHPDKMFFTRVGLAQATDEWVAAYKASRVGEFLQNSHPRLGETRLLADLCCGIGGDLRALTQRAGSVSARSFPALGIDFNPIAAHFAAINSGASVRTMDAAQVDVDDFAAWHIDPDRRAGGRRTTTLEAYEPNLSTIERLLARNPHAAIKLAPATEVPAAWLARCELEWISRDRECRQQVAWHGNLALSPGVHRATIILASRKRQRPETPETPRTIIGEPDQSIPLASQPDQYLFDADPAVRAAHLTGTLAAEHGLTALAIGPTYLTGPHEIVDAALSCFQIDNVLPLRAGTLAAYLRERRIGSLEIKTRGIDIDAEKLRRELKLRGDNAATLLVTKLASRPTAILATRVFPHLLTNFRFW